MTEITDLSETDSANTVITGNSTDGNIANMSAMDNVIQSILGLLKRSLKSSIWRLRDSTDQTKLLAFDLSGLPTATTTTVKVPAKGGTLATTGGPDLRRNRIVNGDMKDSQENGATAGTANGYYAADQFATYRVTSAGVITSQRVASVSPAGSPYRYRVTITTADAALAAGEYLTISQNLEGSNVADFQYGTANAKASVDRFGFKGPAGTYAVAYHNSAANRSFVALFTISAGQANTDTVQEIAVPGDTSGTWLTADGVIGITRDVVLACGSTFQGVAGWQSGNILGTSGVSNGMGTGSAVFELFDVGLKLDPDATGVYGAYEVGPVDAVYRSERYWEKLSGANVLVGAGFAVSTSSASVMWVFNHRKAKAPVVAGSANTNDFGVTGSAGSFVNFEFSASFLASDSSTGITVSTGTGLTAGQGAIVFTAQSSSSLAANARLS